MIYERMTIMNFRDVGHVEDSNVHIHSNRKDVYVSDIALNQVRPKLSPTTQTTVLCKYSFFIVLQTTSESYA